MHLVACPDCRRQYDVTHHPAGERVRCLCGELFNVVHHESHAPRVVRCSSCAGALEADARVCPYCSCEVTIEERLLDSICPGCFARLARDAKFCMECGIEILPQALVPVPEATPCPRCRGELRSRDLGRASVIECGGCGGLWCPTETFKRIYREASAAREVVGDKPIPEAGKHPFRYLPCLSCDDMMTPRNFAGNSGIMIDVCREHGVWLDHSELERIVAFVARNGSPRRDPTGTGPTTVPNPDILKTEPVRSGNDGWLIFDVLTSVGEFLMTDW